MKGFVLLEVFIVITILAILAGMILPNYRSFQKEANLDKAAEELLSALRLAKSKTLASELNSRWGVYFTTSTQPNQYILFKGSDYFARDPSQDEVHIISDSVVISEVGLGGGNQAVFERVTGKGNVSGSLKLALKEDLSKTRQVYIDSLGMVGLGSLPQTPGAGRVLDSRHVHLNYSRQISILTENMILNFGGGAVREEIPIADNLQDGQIFWEGEVVVQGKAQKLKIHTHKLNNPDTQLSLHRDRRYNDQSLDIGLSGDTSGNIISYSADGLTTVTPSLYVTSLEWQ